VEDKSLVWRETASEDVCLAVACACRFAASLSPAAGLLLLEAKTQAGTRRAAHGCRGNLMRVPVQVPGSKASASGNLPQALMGQIPRERCPHPVIVGWPSASDSEDAGEDASSGARLP